MADQRGLDAPVDEGASGESSAPELEFFDPLHGAYSTLVLGDSARESGVRHDGCDALALVEPAIDSAWCSECSWQARISGAWVMSHFEEALDA